MSLAILLAGFVGLFVAEATFDDPGRRTAGALVCMWLDPMATLAAVAWW